MRSSETSSLSAYRSRVLGWVRPWLPLVGVGLAILGQRLLEGREYAVDGAAALLAGCVLFFWGLRSLRDAWPATVGESENPRYVPSFPRARYAAAWVCVLACAVAWLRSGNNQFTTVGALAWLAAILSFVVAAWERPVDAPPLQERIAKWLRGPWRLQIGWHAVLLILILALGVFLRFYLLPDIPNEPGSDHAEKLLDVQTIVDGQRPIFFWENTGREPMQFYLTYALIRYLGIPIGFMALKIGTALIGSLALLAVYLLAREAFNKDLALIVMFLVAVSQWHLGVSRMGLRYPFPSLWVSLAMLFLLRAMRYRRRSDFLLCGVMTGIGLHTYIPCRVMPLVVAVVFLLNLLLDRQARREGVGRYLTNCVLCGLAALVVFLPLMRYMVDQPDVFWFRTFSRLTSLEQPIPGNPWLILLSNIKNALLAFNWMGDVVPVTTIPLVPFLDFVSGGLFLLGFVWIVRLTLRGDRTAIYLLIGFFASLLPSVLSLAYPGENPSVVRMSAAIPFAYAFAALPAYAAFQAARQLRPISAQKVIPWLLLIAIGLGTARVNYTRYFVVYANQYRANTANAEEIGKAMKGFVACCGAMENVYHVAWPYWVDTRNIGIAAGDIKWRNALHDDESVRATAENPGAKLYILHPDDQGHALLLQELFPLGTLRRFASVVPGHDFCLFIVPDEP